MTAIGKILVVINVALSLLFLAWSVAIFTQSVDWGWKEPRKEFGEKVPSELEKRQKADKSAHEAIKHVHAAFLKTHKDLEAHEQTFTRNHLWYTQELAKLESEKARAGADIQEVKIKKGTGSPELLGGPTSRPGMVKVEPLLVSLEGYRTVLDNLEKEIKRVSDINKKTLEEAAEITKQLSGIHDEDGTILKKGIYHLLDIEARALAQLQAEISHVQPLRIKELVNRAVLIDRRTRLEARVEELRKPKVVSKAP
jgi:hypothetical protein